MSKTGRYYVKDRKIGRVFCVEPINESEQSSQWGQPTVNKKFTGKYGEKEKGSIKEKDSIITKENKFKNIVNLKQRVSPESYIEKILKNT